MSIRTLKDLDIYQVSFELAMDIYKAVQCFPKSELYSLTDQIKRSSRSISANIGEGWAKRRYGKIFFKHLLDAYGSCEETKIWLDFSEACGYLRRDEYLKLSNGYNRLSAMIYFFLKRFE